MSKLRLWIRNYWVLVWFFVFVFFLVLGYAGIVVRLYQQRGEVDWRFVVDSFYLLLRMTTLDGFFENENSLLIVLGRLFIPLTLIVFSVSAVLSLLRDRLLLFWAHSFYRRHWIVAGLSEASLAFLDLLKKRLGVRVAVLEESSDSQFINYCRVNQVPFLIGDGEELYSYDGLGIERAGHVLLMWEDDMKNIRIARRIHEEFGSINIMVHIKDFWLKHYYDRVGILKEPAYRVRTFSVYEAMSRMLFLKEPLDRGVNRVENPWIVVVGTGRVALSLVLRSILYKVYPEGKNLRITLAGPGAESVRDTLVARFSSGGEYMLKDVVLEAVEINYERINYPEDVGIRDGSPQAIFVCTERDTETLRIFEELGEVEGKPQIIGLLNSYQEFFSGEGKIYSVYRLASETILNLDEVDLFAMKTHEIYYQECRKRKSTSEACVEWERLKEVYKNSNRNSADHIWEKLRVVDPEARYTDAQEPRRLQALVEEFRRALEDEETIELLVGMEHRRYMRERVVLRDWQKVKKYDYYRPDELGREYTLNNIKSIPEILSVKLSRR